MCLVILCWIITSYFSPVLYFLLCCPAVSKYIRKSIYFKIMNIKSTTFFNPHVEPHRVDAGFILLTLLKWHCGLAHNSFGVFFFAFWDGFCDWCCCRHVSRPSVVRAIFHLLYPHTYSVKVDHFEQAFHTVRPQTVHAYGITTRPWSPFLTL